jgi:LCP family protein required for cell wall assembly
MNTTFNTSQMSEITKPSRRMDRLETVRTVPVKRRKKKRSRLLFLLFLFLIYFLAPFRTNVLFLGTDDSPERGGVGRTDTIILASVVPFKPYIGILSIPRDLWVQIPNVGEQRINTAYFYAEANETGSGAEAARATIRQNMDVPVWYHVVIHMNGLVSLVDALGGIEITLDQPAGSLPAGTHYLNGFQALAFARDRSTSDDFGRMAGTQKLITALMQKLLQPSSWSNLPQFVIALGQTIDTNIPLWQGPRLLFAVLRAPLFGIDGRTISRDMVTPFTTSQGAQVLLPNWEAMRPTLKEMFGR